MAHSCVHTEEVNVCSKCGGESEYCDACYKDITGKKKFVCVSLFSKFYGGYKQRLHFCNDKCKERWKKNGGLSTFAKKERYKI
jgi:hypothetical protein